MKKIACFVLVFCLLTACFAGAENAFTVENELSDNARVVGALYVDEGADLIPIVFETEVENVTVSHASGVSVTIKSVRPGDAILAYSFIPDTTPNLSVSYSLPGDAKLHKKMISQSGYDASYLILNTPEAEMAWQTVLAMKEIISDKAYLEAMSVPAEIMGIITKAAEEIPDEMPENYYWIDTGILAKALLETEEFDIDSFREAAKERVIKKLPVILLNSLNSRLGTAWVAAGSIMVTEDVLYTPDISIVPGLIVFDTGRGILPVAAVSMPGEDITSIYATCVLADLLAGMDEIG